MTVPAVEQHSVRADRLPRPPADIAGLAREAATEIARGHEIEGLRRLVAIGGLAKAAADTLEAGR